MFVNRKPTLRQSLIIAVMDPSKVTIPPMKDLSTDNITENTILMNSQGPDERFKYVMARLVTHLHDFAREVRLSTKEWMAALDFLIKVGQISSDVRNVSQNNKNRASQFEY